MAETKPGDFRNSDQTIYLDNPHPVVPPRRSAKGRAPSRLKSTQAAQTVAAWVAAQPAQAWRRLALRDGEKGEIVADFLQARVFVWDGTESTARHWHLLVRREPDGVILKYCLSNAKEGASLRHLATMQTARYFVERAFNDAKSACGMADYQVRGCIAGGCLLLGWVDPGGGGQLGGTWALALEALRVGGIASALAVQAGLLRAGFDLSRFNYLGIHDIRLYHLAARRAGRCTSTVNQGVETGQFRISRRHLSGLFTG